MSSLFSCCRKETRDETVRMTGGWLFLARDAASGTARSPRVNRCADGTTSVMVVDERRWRRPSTSAVRRTLSARYGGSDPLKHRNARTQRRNWIRSWTHNRWRSRRSGVMLDPQLRHVQTRCAAVSEWAVS